MVRRHIKGGRKPSNGRLCVITARRGARRPRAKQINRIGRLMGTSQWANKRKFYDLYGQIVSLITVKVDEPLIRAAIQFWNPSHKCFTFNEEDLMPTAEEYSILIRLNL